MTEVYGRLGAEGYLEGRAGGGSVVSAAQWPTRPRLPVAALSPTPRASATRPYGTNPEATAPYDCRPGHLDPALFPVAAWRRCAIGALDQPVNQYGDPAGTSELRTALAHWVTRSRGVAATAADLFVTAGAGHAVDLIARVLVEPGDVVAVEEPGYPAVVELLRSHGLRSSACRSTSTAWSSTPSRRRPAWST